MTTGDREAAALRPAIGARIGLLLGPALAILISVLPPPEGLERVGMLVAAVLVLMAVWWATEAVPIAVTSLLPLGLLPLTGVAPLRDIAAPYADHVVLLLLGGFIIAIGIEKWDLHRRIALNVLVVSGARLKLLAAGFMLATALLSMWISNTATTLMMAPIALSVAVSAGGGVRLATALLLGIAYSASIGGLATPVGTPTNLIAMGWLRENAGVDISFREWMSFGLPVTLMMLPLAWLVLTWRLKSTAGAAEAASATVRQQRDALGRMTTPETRVAMVFGAVALAWMTREQLVMIPLLSGLTDMGIAILGAIAMFLVPHGGPTTGERRRGWALLTWDDAKALPWEVVLLFGGGLSLADPARQEGPVDDRQRPGAGIRPGGMARQFARHPLRRAADCPDPRHRHDHHLPDRNHVECGGDDDLPAGAGRTRGSDGGRCARADPALRDGGLLRLHAADRNRAECRRLRDPPVLDRADDASRALAEHRLCADRDPVFRPLRRAVMQMSQNCD